MGTVLERLDGVSKAMRRLRRELDTPNHRFDPKEVTRKVMIDLDALEREVFNRALPSDRIGGVLSLDQERAMIVELRACRKVVEAAVRYRQAEVRYSEGTLNERVPNGTDPLTGKTFDQLRAEREHAIHQVTVCSKECNRLIRVLNEIATLSIPEPPTAITLARAAIGFKGEEKKCKP